MQKLLLYLRGISFISIVDWDIKDSVLLWY